MNIKLLSAIIDIMKKNWIKQAGQKGGSVLNSFNFPILLTYISAKAESNINSTFGI